MLYRVICDSMPTEAAIAAYHANVQSQEQEDLYTGVIHGKYTELSSCKKGAWKYF